MDITKMTDQQIIEHMRSRGADKAVINTVISQSIEDFYTKHGIVLRCPHCGSKEKSRNGKNSSGITRYKCKACGKGYAPTTNTIFDGTNYTVDEAISILHCVLTEQSIPFTSEKLKKNGEPLNYNSVWLMYHKFLRIIAQFPNEHLSGAIQIDEKFFRETQKGSHSLVSLLDPKENRNARKNAEASKCGIFGPEFVNVLCAVDDKDHYWAKCVRMGPLQLEDLEAITDFHNIAYICSDNLSVYSEWCDNHGYQHYVEPSTYKKERKARGYIDTSGTYRNLTPAEYKLDEQINRQMYKEGLYPHIENSPYPLSFDEFNDTRKAHNLGLHKVNGFHSVLENFLQNTKGVSTEYLEDYIALFVYTMNYKKKHKINSFGMDHAENILVEIIRHTLKTKYVPTRDDIEAQTFSHFERPSKRATTIARKKMIASRAIVAEPPKYYGYEGAYEGDDEISQNIFNKRKFFTSLGTVRINELCKLYRVYDRSLNKAQKVERLCNLENAEDVIFHEIYVRKYGTVDEMTQAFNKMPEKRKRGRPKKTA